MISVHHCSTYYTYGLEDDEKKDGKVLAFAPDILKATWTFTLSVWTSHNEKYMARTTKTHPEMQRVVKNASSLFTIIFKITSHRKTNGYSVRRHEYVVINQYHK